MSMGLETVIEEILARGREEADAIRRSAEADRDRLLQEAKAEGAKLLVAREQEARLAAERARIQDLARAELESKRTVLAAQKEVLDEVYARALQRLATLPDRDAVVRALLDANASEWRTGKVYASPRDADTVRAIVGPNFAGTTEALGGGVIESADGTRKTDLRFEILFADVWRDSIREVAEILWPKL
jgi:V/A-type H+-transporting ATPase subunit E